MLFTWMLHGPGITGAYLWNCGHISAPQLQNLRTHGVQIMGRNDRSQQNGCLLYQNGTNLASDSLPDLWLMRTLWRDTLRMRRGYWMTLYTSTNLAQMGKNLASLVKLAIEAVCHQLSIPFICFFIFLFLSCELIKTVNHKLIRVANRV